MIFYLYSSTTKSTTVFKLNYEIKNDSSYIINQLAIPNKGYLHAAIANDRFGNFYILASKNKLVAGATELPETSVISVLVVDYKGQIRREVPLRRLDGRFVRGGCEFLSVNDSGDRWWTLRQSRELAENWKQQRKAKKRTALLNVYDNRGKPLSEWEVTLPLASETFAVAAIKNEIYVAPEILEQKKQFLFYRLGNLQPQKYHWPGSWSPTIGGSFIGANGQFWHLGSGQAR
ncbi:hypothetical protein [Abditibacterium utsteinense]|uniref:hypothetical protein n=1 Tax=Abditibacterium utsteinense TaxID=1960156 RepID=UPI001EE715B5|nr:hypothetical protein [Abditibacterium utsteinense]